MNPRRKAGGFFAHINISQTFWNYFIKNAELEYGRKSKTEELKTMSNQEMKMRALEHDVSEANVETAIEAAKATAEVIVEEVTPVYKKIEEGVVTGYKKIEDGVVGGYKKIEEGVVEGFGKVVDKCVEKLFAKEGESVEEAKKRLSGEE